MIATYQNVDTPLLPTAAEWDTAIGAGRSKATDAVGLQLVSVEQGKGGLQPFLELDVALKQLLAAGATPDAAVVLNKQVDQLKNVVRDRETLMQRVEKLLRDSTGWPSKCLCAELYTANDDPWGANKAIAGVLEKECRLVSGWAMNAPNAFEDFCEKGEADANAVQQWPNLTSKARILLPSQGIAWPPAWGGTAWRKGLYCHSSAAIAAWALDANRLDLGQGLGVQIKSIDIVQQMPASKGTMSHWWVFVNRPDDLKLSGGAKAVTNADQWEGFELAGGFVVDIWGALWSDQREHATEWATNNAASTQKAVQDAPFIPIEDMSKEKARLHVRKVYA